MALSNAKALAVYRTIQREQRNLDFRAAGLSALFAELLAECLAVLSAAKRRPLTSLVKGKTYFAFEADGRRSRAINDVLYAPSLEGWDALVLALAEDDFSRLDETELTRTIYSLAFSFFAVIDLTKTGDQGTPGALFEYLIAHLYASRLGVNPTRRLPVLNLDLDTTLPTDFILDLGADRPKFHLPVKISTRERIIQVWAHQRVYGTGRFLGTPVIATQAS